MDGYNQYLTKSIVLETAGSVYPTTIQQASIGNRDLKGNSISTIKLADEAVTGPKIANATITASNITNSTITGTQIANSTITGGNIATGTITANKLSVSSLSAISANLGTITAGTISGTTITLPASTGIGTGATGYLRWGGNSNKIWIDGNNYMGLQASGERFYFYTGTVLYALFQRGSQASFYSGVAVTGNFNTTGNGRVTGYMMVGNRSPDSSAIHLKVDGYTTLFGILYLNNYSIRDVGAMTFRAQEISSNNQLFVRASDGKLVFKDSGGSYHTLY